VINQLIADMQNQMNIKRFTKESTIAFNRRIVYSAAAAWVKELTNGKSYTSIIGGKNNQGVDFIHVKYHLSKVLSALCSCIEIGSGWNKSTSQEIFVNGFASYVLRKGVECPHNLVYIEDGHHIMESPSRLIQIGNHFLLRGNATKSSDFFYVGFCQWSRAKSDYIIDDKINPAFTSVDMLYSSFFTDIKWKETVLKGRYSYYVPGKDNLLKLSWSAYSDKRPLSDGVYLFYDNQSRSYFMIKQENNRLMTASLDSWYIKNEEIYRIQYSLDYKNNTCRSVFATFYDEFVILKLVNKLPLWELNLVIAASWPLKTYDDEWERIIPIELWDSVKLLIEGLGLLIQESDGIRDGRNWYSKNT